MIKFAEFKRFFIFNLIGSLIVSALVAVVTVLMGTFNEITGRVFFTLWMVVCHSLISLGFIWDDEKQNTFERLALFVDVLFLLIVISFVTSIFGIWKIIPSELVWNLYQTYFVVAFASLHGDILSKVLNKVKNIDLVIYLNYAFMFGLVLMMLPAIFIDESAKVLGEMYFRVMGAVGIVDGTLSILAIIFYKLYTNSHPQEKLLLSFATSSSTFVPKKGLSLWVWVSLVYLVFQIIFSFFGYFLRSFQL